MKRGLAAAAFGSLTLGGHALSLASEAAPTPLDEVFAYDIPAKALLQAVHDVCNSAKLTCGAKGGVMEGKRAPAIQGKLSVRSALTRALSRTGLTYNVIDATTISIVPRTRTVEVAKSSAPMPNAEEHPAATPAATSNEPLPEVKISVTLNKGDSPLSGPLIVLTAKDIKRLGAFSTEDLVNLFPQSFNSSTPLASLVFSSIAGAPNTNWGAALDLRALGPAATVVLLNRQKAPPSAGGQGQYFDLTTLPLDMVVGIQVGVDGASVLYGPSAIGGVANLELPVPEAGARTSVNLSAPIRGGGKIHWLNQSFGYHWQKVRAGISFRLQKQEPVYADARDATYRIADSNYQRAHIVPDNDLGVALATLEWDVGADKKLRFDGSLGRKNMESLYTSTALNGVNVTNRAKTDQIWGMGEYAYSLPHSWTGRVNAGASRSHVEATLSQHIPVLEWLMESNGDTSYFAQYVGGHVEGPVLPNLHRGVILAFDTGYRREKAEGTAFQGASDSMSVKHGSVELTLRMFHTNRGGVEVPRLVFSAAERYESHSSFGGSTVHKFGFAYRPVGPLTLRATTGESIRAPQLSQLSLAGSWQTIDNVSGVSADGEPIRVVTRYGSNPGLGPERARTVTAGVDLRFESPAELLLSVTWFSEKYTDRIESAKVSSQKALNDPAYEAIRTRRDQVGDDVKMNAAVAAVIGAPDSHILPCRVPRYTSGPCALESAEAIGAILDFRPLNLAETFTKGLDLGGKITWDTRFGTFSARFDGTRLFAFDNRVTQASAAIDDLNTIFHPPRTRWRVGTEYERGGFQINAYVNYMNAYTNDLVAPNERIESHATVDLSIHLNLKSYDLDLRANNLLDADPPYVTSPSRNGFNFDALNANPYGCVISFTATKRW